MSDIPFVVSQVLFDPKTKAAVAMLKERDGGRVLPIWIGQAEAISIAMGMEKVSLARPMTHDLLKSVLEKLGVFVEWISVSDLEDGTFFARIKLSKGKEQVEIDSRPSDAIALALRVDAPIFVAERVVAEAAHTPHNLPRDLAELEDDLLASLPDETFGKYKM